LVDYLDNMELFARISCTYPAGDQNIKMDDDVNKMLNERLKTFIKENKISDYKILNGQTTTLAAPAYGPGKQSVQCSLFISYRIQSS
jgi:hypothetical protein